MQLELLGLKNSLVKNVPSFDKAGLGLVPVTGMDQALNIHHVIVADRDDAGQLADCCMNLVRDRMDGLSVLGNYLFFQVVGSVLNAARADHGEETGILQGDGIVVVETIPPDVVFLQENGRIYNVVVKVDVIDEELDEVVWGVLEYGGE